MQIVVAFFASALAFAVIDAVWIIGFIGPAMRASVYYMAETPNMYAAVVFYVLHLVGMTYFATSPALSAGTWRIAAGRGFLFGVFCYQTYEMTNLAILDAWPVYLAIADVIWGGVLTALSATAGYFAASALGSRRGRSVQTAST